MSSLYAQSKQCQLFGHEVVTLIEISATLFDATTKGTLAEASRVLLTSAHLRQLTTDALVRVAIPPRKLEALVHGNPYIVAAASIKAATAARAKNGAAGTGAQAAVASPSSPSPLTEAASTGESVTSVGEFAGTERHYLPTHRVGRVVALLPKPGSAAADAAATATNANPPSLATSADDWMLAVAFGEATDVFALRFLSDDPFTEEEHQIYVQSCLGRRSGASPVNGAVAAAIPSGEQAQALIGRLNDMRAAFLLTGPHSVRNDGGEESAEKRRARQGLEAAVEGLANSRKRARIADGGGTEGTAPSEVSNHQNCAHRSGVESKRSVTDPVQPAELARLREVVARQAVHLQSLRSLLQAKEGELASVHQSHRAAEQQHAADISQLRGKAEDEARARERSLRETAEQLQERDSRLQAAGKKLHQVAELAERYKKVYNALVAGAMGFTPEQARATTPEDVIAILKAKKTLEPY